MSPGVDLRDLTAARLAELNRSPTEAARLGSLEKNFLLDILTGKKLSVHSRNLAKLAKALDLEPGEIAAALSASATQEAGQVPRTSRRSEAVRARVPVPDFQALPRDLPVYGTAHGSVVPKLGESFALDPARVVRQVRRPTALFGVRDAYAIYVAGESMAPLYRPGDLLVVDPNKPPRPGDTVVLQVRPGEGLPTQAFVKIYIGRTPENVLGEQLHPKAMAQFKASTVIAVHRVLTLAELLEA